MSGTPGQPRDKRAHAIHGVVHAASFSRKLPQEGIQVVLDTDSGVNFGVGAGYISPDSNQVLRGLQE